MKAIICALGLLCIYAIPAAGGGVPEKIDGGVPKSIDGGVPKTIDGGVPKELDGIKKPDRDAAGKQEYKKTPEKQTAPITILAAEPAAESVPEIGFRVDEIIKDRGFISRNQCRAGAKKKMLLIIAVTNTEAFAGGDWLGGPANDFRESGVMTNFDERFRVIIPARPLRPVHPPKYDTP